MVRTIRLELHDHVDMYDTLEGKIKNDSLPSKDKLRVKFMSGADWQHRQSRFVQKERLIDRDADRYFEKVTDPDTGEIIHHCDEPLSEHWATVLPSSTRRKKTNDHAQH